MARDYKNTPKPRDKKPRQAPPWAWLLTGLAIGLFVALLVYLKDQVVVRDSGGSKPPAVIDKGKPAAPAPKTEDAKEPAAQRPRFDFYNLLPDMEVPVPDEDLAAEREREPAEAVTYYLQVASFKRFEDADRLRAQLAFLNLESHIQRVSVMGQDQHEQIYHRVRVGPFDSARKMDQVRSKLRAESLDPIVLKIKG